MVDRNLVEAVTELKAQYTVSTASAYFFLKRQAACRALWERVRAAVPEVSFPFRAFVNLVDAIPGALTLALSGDSPRNVVAPFLPMQFHRARLGDPDPEEMRWTDNQKKRLWELDYERFLVTLAHLVRRGEQLAVVLARLRLFLMDDAAFYFTDTKGARFSFQNLRDHLAAPCTAEPPWEQSGMTKEEFEAFQAGCEIADETLAEDAPLDSADGESDPTEEDVEECEADMLFCAATRFDATTTGDERKYLIHDEAGEYGLFERAERERTMHRLEVERRAAINAFTLWRDEWFKEYPDEQPEFAAVYAFALEGCKRMLANRMERIRRLQALIGPPVVLQHEFILRDTTRHQLLALKKNRSWLEEVFSR